MANTIKAVVTNTTPAELVFYYDEVDHSSEGTVLEVSSTGYTSPESAPWCAYIFTSVRFDNSCQNWEPTSLRYFFGYSTANTTITSIDCTNLNTSNVTDMRYTFSSCSGLTSIDVSGFNTSKVTSMEALFYKCSSLTSIDISNFDTSNVINMPSMFRSCSELTELDLSNFSTTALSNVSVMFSDDINLEKIYINKDFNVSNVTNGTNTFRNCSSLPRFSSSNVDSTMAKAVNYGGYLYIKPKERHFFYNTNDPLNITYNTNVVRKVKYNNTEVWNRTRLPQEYQEVEYIESTGTQYIDTGIVPNNETGVMLKVSVSNITTDTFIFGCKQDNSNTRFSIGKQNGACYFGFGSVTNPGASIWGITQDIPFTAYLNYYDNRKAYINSAAERNLGSISNITFTYSLVLLGKNISGNISGVAQKIYECKITENNDLIADYVPCYRKSDGEIGLYDLVTDTFLTNSGTGTFLKGQSINYILPDTYQEVQYIESSGTQFINTGINPDNNTKVEIQFFNNSISSWYIFGSRNGQSGTIWFSQSGSSANSTIYPRVNGEGSPTEWTRNTDGAIYYVELSTKTDKYDYKIKDITNNREVNRTDVYFTQFETTDRIYICALNSLNIQNATTRIYKFNLYKNKILVRKLVPCYRKLDNVAGMYDIVSEKFFTNDGTGSFAVGNNI